MGLYLFTFNKSITMYQPEKQAPSEAKAELEKETKMFRCIHPWYDKENGLAIMKGSIVELIEKGHGLYLVEVIKGIDEGLQMPFTSVQMAEHFEIN